MFCFVFKYTVWFTVWVCEFWLVSMCFVVWISFSFRSRYLLVCFCANYAVYLFRFNSVVDYDPTMMCLCWIQFLWYWYWCNIENVVFVYWFSLCKRWWTMPCVKVWDTFIYREFKFLFTCAWCMKTLNYNTIKDLCIVKTVHVTVVV